MEHVGVDVAKRKLQTLWLREPDTGRRKEKGFANTPAGVAGLAEWLERVTGCSPADVQVVMEATSDIHVLDSVRNPS